MERWPTGGFACDIMLSSDGKVNIFDKVTIINALTRSQSILHANMDDAEVVILSFALMILIVIFLMCLSCICSGWTAESTTAQQSSSQPAGTPAEPAAIVEILDV